MAAEAPQLEGLNPTYVIVDEVHALPDRTLWDVFLWRWALGLTRR